VSLFEAVAPSNAHSEVDWKRVSGEQIDKRPVDVAKAWYIGDQGISPSILPRFHSDTSTLALKDTLAVLNLSESEVCSNSPLSAILF